MNGFLKWLDNYWYHHKWATLISLFFIIVAMLIVVQVASNDTHDCFVMYVGGEISTDDQEKITAALSDICDDYDGDGERSVAFSRLLFFENGNLPGAPTANNEAKNAVSAQLAGGGDYYIFFMSPKFYPLFEGSGMFVPIADILGHESDAQADACTLVLGKTALYKDKRLSALPADTLVCVKMVTYSIFDTEKRDVAQQHHFDLLKKIAE